MQLKEFHSLVLIGKGASSFVYSAFQESLKRNVAIKKSNISSKNESTLLAQLKHPSLVLIYDQFSDKNFNYIVQEKLEGLSLKDIKSLDIRTLIKSFQQYAEGLHYLHNQGYVHGDLSNENLFITKDLDTKILDLENAIPIGKVSLSGTNGFQNPESTNAKPLNPLSDIYSLALCLYQSISGERLFKGDWEATSEQIRSESIPKLSEKIPGELSKLIKRALRISEPFEDADEFAEELEVYCNSLKKIDTSKTSIAINEQYKAHWIKSLNQSYAQNKSQKNINEMAHLLKLLEETGGSYVEEWTELSKLGKKKKDIKKPLILLNICFILLLIFVQFIKTNEANDLKTQMDSDLQNTRNDLSKQTANKASLLKLNKIWVQFADSLITKQNIIDGSPKVLTNSGLFLSSGPHTLSGLNEKNDTLFTKEFILLDNGDIIWK